MMTAMISDGSEEAFTVFQSRDPFTILLWLLAVTAVHRLVFGCAFKDVKCTFWDFVWRFERKKAYMHFGYALCPKRIARYYKCSKRSSARQERTIASSDPCMIRELLSRVHLPAPLPWKKKGKKKATRQCQGCVQEKSNEATEEAVENVPKVSSRNLRTEAFAAPVAPLIDLARMQNWDLILKSTTRKQAKYRDSDGLYPLHWAVSGGPPLQVVETLLQAYPSAARKLDREGSAPLHFATHYSASPGVVEALLKVYPKAIRLQDRHGRSPLYHAVDKGMGLEALKLLVYADPSMITVPCLPVEHRDLPLTRTTATMTPLYMAWIRVIREMKVSPGKLIKCKRYEKARLLLEASFFHMKNEFPSVLREFHFISGAIEMDIYLPEEVVSFGVAQFPMELSYANKEGRVPLAQAAASSQYSRDRSDALLSLLLKAYAPAASKRDNEGSSPLQLALLAGKTWSAGVLRLFQSYPDAISMIDDKTGLPPFATAASLEAQEAAAAASRLVGETPQAAIGIRNDPYNLLTSKQRELLDRARVKVENRNTASREEHVDSDTERLTTILDLLRSDPAVLRC